MNELTEPLRAPIALAELFNEARDMYNLLLQITQIETDDETGKPISINMHPDVKFWFDQMRRIASESAKIAVVTEESRADRNVELIKTMLTKSDLLPQNVREQIAQNFLKKEALPNP